MDVGHPAGDGVLHRDHAELAVALLHRLFDAGVGEKFFMLFGVEHITEMPQSYIMFEAAQYDSFGYLFTNPKFISLDGNAMPGNIPLRGMRIGINGAEPLVGQAYRMLDTAIADAKYSPTTGQTLSNFGTIIVKVKTTRSAVTLTA